jgi:hypothetical protein
MHVLDEAVDHLPCIRQGCGDAVGERRVVHFALAGLFQQIRRYR